MKPGKMKRPAFLAFAMLALGIVLLELVAAVLLLGYAFGIRIDARSSARTT